MITITQAVEQILHADIEALNTLARGVLNLSAYAKQIQSNVEEVCKKQVKYQSIVVILSRLAENVKSRVYLPTVPILQTSLRSGVVELVYLRTVDNLAAVGRVASVLSSHGDVFFSCSTSSKDIAIIVSEEIANDIERLFNEKPLVYKRDLVVVGVRFPHEMVAQSGVGFALMQKVATAGIVLSEVVSAYNEFTIVCGQQDLQKLLQALHVAND